MNVALAAALLSTPAAPAGFFATAASALDAADTSWPWREAAEAVEVSEEEGGGCGSILRRGK